MKKLEGVPDLRDWKAFVRGKLSLPGLKGNRERDIIDEVASQLEDVYQDCLSRGMSDSEAEAAVDAHIPDWDSFAKDLLKAERSRRRAKGDQWAETSSEALRARGGRWIPLADFVQDLRYSLRGLRAAPGFTAVAILTLALGIGGVATIFTFYDQVLVRPLPYQGSQELVELWEKLASFENASVAYPNFLDWRERNRVFEDVGVWNETRMSLTGSGDPEQVLVGRVSAAIFPLLRVNAVEGRVFLPEEDRLGASPVVLLSHAFWQERFAGDPGALGRVLTLDGYPAEVVGILPESFRFPPGVRGVDLYAPAELFAEDWIENRGNHPGLTGLARLRPGVTLEEARQDLDRVAMELEAEYFDTNQGSRVHVASLQERVIRDAREPLLLLLLAVTFLLLIACINVANLVLARATGRQQEMAVRASIGAGRTRILRLLLTETLALWFLGGVLGVILARVGVGALARLMAEELPPIFQVGLDLRVVAVVLGLSLTTGLVFGLPPALRVARDDLREFLKEGRRTVGTRARSRFRSALVVAEVSLAVALLVGSGLTLRSVSKILEADPGLDPSNLLAVELNLPTSSYPETPERTVFYTQLLDRVRALPGVLSAATTYVVPLGPGGWQNSYHVEGEPPQEGGQHTFAEVSSVSTDYFRTLGIPLSRGRDFTRQDDAEAPAIAIVDEAFATRHWPGEDPLGKRFKWGGFESEDRWVEVVGLVGHVTVNGVVEEALPQIYIPHWQDNSEGYFLMVKVRGDPLALVEPLRRVVLALDPSIPLASVETMDAYVQETTRTQQILALLMSIFSVAAMLLAGVGVYGVMAQTTAERRHEIGIRVALGARRDQVRGMVLRQGFAIVGVGVAVGLALALGLGQVMSARLFGITATDPVTFLITPIVVAGIALAANLIPAQRAMKMDPVRALQAE
jgi:putative ABC transport system permease protein